jgi:elongation factor Tu
MITPERKQYVNTGTIGHVDHGKTTLTAALSRYCAELTGNKAGIKAYADIDKAPEERARGITINASHICYESKVRQYGHVDCPGHADYIKNMITGASQMDVGILVIAATDGPMPQTKEHIRLARQSGVGSLIVFLNKMDMIDDPDIAMLVQDEVGELLAMNGFDVDKTPFVMGSALQAASGETGKYGFEAMAELIAALDAAEIPPRDVDSPLCMAVESDHSIPGRGTVLTGKILTGRVKAADTVSIVGFGHDRPSEVVTDVQMFHKTVPEGVAGDNVGILIRGLQRGQVKRGAVVCKPGTIKTNTTVKASIYTLTKLEGGRASPFFKGYRPQFYIGTADVTGTIVEIHGQEMIAPGDNVQVTIHFISPVPVRVGDRFAMREGGSTVACGLISEILPPMAAAPTAKP